MLFKEYSGGHPELEENARVQVSGQVG